MESLTGLPSEHNNIRPHHPRLAEALSDKGLLNEGLIVVSEDLADIDYVSRLASMWRGKKLNVVIPLSMVSNYVTRFVNHPSVILLYATADGKPEMFPCAYFDWVYLCEFTEGDQWMFRVRHGGMFGFTDGYTANLLTTIRKS